MDFKKWKSLEIFPLLCSTKTDILLIHKTRKIASMQNMKEISRWMISSESANNENSNGVAVILNKHRFSIINKMTNRQAIILELKYILDDRRLIKENIYINPTYERRYPNDSAIQTDVNAIEMARLNEKKKSLLENWIKNLDLLKENS